MSGGDVKGSSREDEEQVFRGVKQYWGYDGFRPRQERGGAQLAAGRDVCVGDATGRRQVAVPTNCRRCLEEKRTAGDIGR